MVAPEIPVIFGLNIPLDMKWSVYDAMWKHVYPIKKALKEEILYKSLLFIAFGLYRRTFTIASRIVPMNDDTNRMVRITNNTHYLDAMLFDLHVLTQNFEVVHNLFGFSCIIWEHDEAMDADMDEFDVQLVMKHTITKEEKLELITNLWKQFEYSELSGFVDRIDFDEATIFPVDLL